MATIDRTRGKAAGKGKASKANPVVTISNETVAYWQGRLDDTLRTTGKHTFSRGEKQGIKEDRFFTRSGEDNYRRPFGTFAQE